MGWVTDSGGQWTATVVWAPGSLGPPSATIRGPEVFVRRQTYGWTSGRDAAAVTLIGPDGVAARWTRDRGWVAAAVVGGPPVLPTAR